MCCGLCHKIHNIFVGLCKYPIRVFLHSLRDISDFVSYVMRRRSWRLLKTALRFSAGPRSITASAAGPRPQVVLLRRGFAEPVKRLDGPSQRCNSNPSWSWKSKSRIKPWKVKYWKKKCPTHECPKTIHVLKTVPWKIVVRKFNLWYKVGHSYLGPFTFTILGFRFLWSWCIKLWKITPQSEGQCYRHNYRRFSPIFGGKDVGSLKQRLWSINFCRKINVFNQNRPFPQFYMCNS
jgi:hypothetical protein